MTRTSDVFSRAIRFRTPTNTGHFKRPKPSVHYSQPTERPKADTKQQRARDAIIEAAEKQRRLYERYRRLHTARLQRVQSEHEPARRFLRAIVRVAPALEYTGKRECDADLAELARRFGLCDDCGIAEYDRFAIYEEALDHLSLAAKHKGLKDWSKDDEWFHISPPTALDELKMQLGLR